MTTIDARLRALEAVTTARPVDPALTWGEVFTQLRGELEAGHIEERQTLTGDGRPRSTYLAYAYGYAIRDYQYILEIDALFLTMELLRERGDRPRTLDELRQCLDRLEAEYEAEN